MFSLGCGESPRTYTVSLSSWDQSSVRPLVTTSRCLLPSFLPSYEKGEICIWFRWNYWACTLLCEHGTPVSGVVTSQDNILSRPSKVRLKCLRHEYNYSVCSPRVLIHICIMFSSYIFSATSIYCCFPYVQYYPCLERELEVSSCNQWILGAFHYF